MSSFARIALSSSLRSCRSTVQPHFSFRSAGAVNFRRAMATQSSMTGPLTEAIKEDHQEMYEYFEEYQKAKGDTDAQARWARQLTWEVARHAVGEEIVVYPLMEKHMGQKGLALADEDRAQHQHVKELLYKLDGLTAGTGDFETTIQQVMGHLRPHNDSEENNDLPELEPLLGEDGSKNAAADFKRTKKFAPTRTHPSAPNKPPFETVVALMSAPIDKLRDTFAAFPTEAMKHAAES